MSSEAITSIVMYPMQTAGDRLVLAGLRSWIAGMHYEDASCWEAGWNVLSNELPPNHARAVFAGLERLAFAVRDAGMTGEVTWPIACRMANRFETLTLAALGLTQRGLRNQALAVMMELDPGMERNMDEITDAMVTLCLALDEAGLGMSCNLEPLLQGEEAGQGQAARVICTRCWVRRCAGA
jgi:putative salt-induced outer membrane protein YdiY